MSCTLGRRAIEGGVGSRRTRRSGGRSDQRGNGPKQTKLQNYNTTYQVPVVLNRSLIVHGAEEVVAERQNHELFKEAITHHELFSGTGNVAVVVKNTHAGVSGNVHLESDVCAHVEISVDRLGRVNAH